MSDAKYFYINLEKETSRYSMSKFLEVVDEGEIILNSYIFDKIRALPQFGLYRVEGKDLSPDMVSFEIYGIYDLWWLILEYNGLTSFDEVVHSMELKYPAIQSIEDLYFTLSSLQNIANKV